MSLVARIYRRIRTLLGRQQNRRSVNQDWLLLPYGFETDYLVRDIDFSVEAFSKGRKRVVGSPYGFKKP